MSQNKISDVTLYVRIYIWSLITEPLLFFVLSDAGTTGVPLTLSRLLQFVFLVSFLFKCLFHYKHLLVINPFSTHYQYASLYIIFIVASSIIGFFSGLYIYDNFSFSAVTDTVIAEVPLGVPLRPFFELFILAYYFLYFLILPKYIIKSNSQLKYFMMWSIRVLYFIIVVGLVDFILYFYGYDFIPRHLFDSAWVKVGLRFHGLVGEPRDAFVYLLFGISILYLNAAVNKKPLPSTKILLIMAICLILTQSFSGLIGLVFGAMLLLVSRKLTVKDYIVALSFIFIVFCVVAIATEYSERTQMYIAMIRHLPQTMTQKELPYLVIVQSPDVVPLWILFERLIHFDLYTLFFGSGIGSASFAINDFMNQVGVNNPRSQLVRILYESGLIGLYIYLLILIRPIKALNEKFDKCYRTPLWISAIMLYGAVLGHRSNLGLIFAGIVLSVYLNRLYETNVNDK